MYHQYSKSNTYLRKAIYEEYGKKCYYCGDLVMSKNMHIDHILATNSKREDDQEFNDYLEELYQSGFVIDSIENYLPTCASCNMKKNNRNLSVGNLRYYHDMARTKSASILKKMEEL